MKKKYKDLLDELSSDNVIEKTINDRILIIDGLNRFLSVFSMVPALNDNGDHVGGVIGFLTSMAHCIRLIRPTRCIVVFDGKGGSTRRRKLYKEYKANRINKMTFNRYDEFKSPESENESMRIQIKRLVEYLNNLPVTLLSIDNCEADDVIAYITKLSPNEVFINSTDKDFYQLVTDKVHIYSPVQKKIYDPEKLLERFNIPAYNILLYRIFTGDTSDNIPGVKGIGLKTLMKLFPKICEEKLTIDDIVNNANEQIKNGSKLKIYKTIVESIDDINRNHQLMQLLDVDISGNMKSIIRDIFSIQPNRINIFEFKRMFAEDRLHYKFKNLDNWLNNSFTQLNYFAK